MKYPWVTRGLPVGCPWGKSIELIGAHLIANDLIIHLKCNIAIQGGVIRHKLQHHAHRPRPVKEESTAALPPLKIHSSSSFEIRTYLQLSLGIFEPFFVFSAVELKYTK